MATGFRHRCLLNVRDRLQVLKYYCPRPGTWGSSIMTLSRTKRISILLVIDVFFFFVELIVGYVIGSLSLVSDSFHMLNDVMSLVIALYAIKLTSRHHTNSRFSYGWNRAEILAALMNGVFLLALCFSIFLEAIQRFTSVREISNPRMIVIVGSLGLASNILGLFLFHEHGHSHGHSHEKNHSESIKTVMPPKTNSVEDKSEEAPSPHTTTTDPTIKIDPHPLAHAEHNQDTTRPWIPPLRPVSLSFYKNPVEDPSSAHTFNTVPFPIHQGGDHQRLGPSHDIEEPERSSWVPPLRPLSYQSLQGYPAATRVQLIQTAHDIALQARTPTPSLHHRDRRTSANPRFSQDTDETQDIEANNTGDIFVVNIPGQASPSIKSCEAVSSDRPMSRAGHERHSHSGSMNMRALMLHVLGDALGNVGVIVSGLIIWLAKGKFRFYFDPIISLIITVIIFSSALPLVRSTAFILLQGVPRSISIEDVRKAILAVEGVHSLHELHVWQLSETKLVASVHVTTFRKHDFMVVALDIRKSLHDLGIHSSTIQPEYELLQDAQPEGHPRTTSCLIPCPSDQKCDPRENYCCPPSTEA